jgi:hypothetical protein
VQSGSRGAATYGLSTPSPTFGGYPSHRAPPCIWTFLSTLGENGFFSILLTVCRTDIGLCRRRTRSVSTWHMPHAQDFSGSLRGRLDNLLNLGRISSGRRSDIARRAALEWSLHRAGRRPSVAAFSDSVAARRERAPPSPEQEA